MLVPPFLPYGLLRMAAPVQQFVLADRAHGELAAVVVTALRAHRAFYAARRFTPLRKHRFHVFDVLLVLLLRFHGSGSFRIVIGGCCDVLLVVLFSLGQSLAVGPRSRLRL